MTPGASWAHSPPYSWDNRNTMKKLRNLYCLPNKYFSLRMMKFWTERHKTNRGKSHRLLDQIARMLLLVNYWHSLDTATVLGSHEVAQECQLTAYNGKQYNTKACILKIRHCRWLNKVIVNFTSCTNKLGTTGKPVSLPTQLCWPYKYLCINIDTGLQTYVCKCSQGY
jgi:hypothetical protein